MEDKRTDIKQENIPESVPITRVILLLKLSDLDFYYEN